MIPWMLCVITISYSTQTLRWDIHGKLLITTSWIYTTVTPQTVQPLAILLQHYCICIIIDYQVSEYILFEIVEGLYWETERKQAWKLSGLGTKVTGTRVKRMSKKYIHTTIIS